MCFIEQVSTRFAHLVVDTAVCIAQRSADTGACIAHVGSEVGFYTSAFVRDCTRIVQNSDGCDTVARFIGEGCNLVDLISRSDKIVRPIITACERTRTFFGALRVTSSIKYIASGDFVDDVKNFRPLELIAGICFAIGRSYNAAIFVVEHNILNIRALGSLVEIVGKIPIFGYFAGAVRLVKNTGITAGPVIDCVFLAAIAALAVGNIKGLIKGEAVERNVVELLSLSADIASGILSLAGYSNPFVFTTLAVIAAGTGIVAFFLDPANTVVGCPT